MTMASRSSSDLMALTAGVLTERARKRNTFAMLRETKIKAEWKILLGIVRQQF